MSGTVEGGYSARDTNISRQGEDWYSRIGARGGKAPCKPNCGFKNKELAQRAGKAGGTVSRRPPTTKQKLQAAREAAEELGCTYCGIYGHIAFECDTRLEDIARKQRILAKYGQKRPW
jgi:general stress protein YciG